MVIKLIKSLKSRGTSSFGDVFKNEVKAIDPHFLPLQQGMSQSSYLAEGDIDVVVLSLSETDVSIQVKTGIFYTGVIAGSCCADDPTPVGEQNEYCEVQFDIDLATADTPVTLL